MAASALALMVAAAGMVTGRGATADELSASGSARGIVIHDAATTLRDYCSYDQDGRLWLALPGGARYELVTSTQDPAIANPGDGAFHAFDADEIRAALAEQSYPLARVRADVYILPYPRRVQLESAAGNELILLSPGVRPLSSDQQQAVFMHELGHVVQYALMPDSDTEHWMRYRRLRGITDMTAYCASAIHADRPHEIFAEDFRALFGGPHASYSGTIENPELALPASVSGLGAFYVDLAGASALTAFTAYPNPTRGELRLARPGGGMVPLDLFDASGRRVATLEPHATGGAIAWTSDGRDARGVRFAPGVLYARPREANAERTRIVVLP